VITEYHAKLSTHGLSERHLVATSRQQGLRDICSHSRLAPLAPKYSTIRQLTHAEAGEPIREEYKGQCFLSRSRRITQR
jgi:hypothetical protein